MRAIVIGGTGLTGFWLVKKLVLDEDYTHIKMVSRKTMALAHPKLEQTIINFENEKEYENAIRDADVIFCCIGTTQKKVKGDKAAYHRIDYDIPVRAARYAKNHSINKYVLISTIGANADSRNFYLQLKGETEEAIINTQLAELHIMRPSLLLGKRAETRLLETIGKGMMQFFSSFLFGSSTRFKPIQAEVLADAMRLVAKANKPGIFIYFYRDIIKILQGTSGSAFKKRMID